MFAAYGSTCFRWIDACCGVVSYVGYCCTVARCRPVYVDESTHFIFSLSVHFCRSSWSLLVADSVRVWFCDWVIYRFQELTTLRLRSDDDHKRLVQLERELKQERGGPAGQRCYLVCVWCVV